MFGNGNSIKQVFTGVLVPFGSEFQTVVEQGEVDTHVVAFFFSQERLLSTKVEMAEPVMGVLPKL